jgi:hypothetical protein
MFELAIPSVSSIVERIRNFRGTRPARMISIVALLIAGVYNLVLESGISSLVFGIPFLTIGLLGLYRLVVGESILETFTSLTA